MKIVQIRSFFWSVFSCIRTDYRKIRTRKNSVFGHFSRSKKVYDGVGDRFILTDLVIIYTRFGSSQPSVSLKITTIASLTRETSSIVPKKLLKNDLAYSLNTFKSHFMRIFAATNASLVCF